jgi:hypothetical protein
VTTTSRVARQVGSPVAYLPLRRTGVEHAFLPVARTDRDVIAVNGSLVSSFEERQ